MCLLRAGSLNSCGWDVLTLSRCYITLNRCCKLSKTIDRLGQFHLLCCFCSTVLWFVSTPLRYVAVSSLLFFFFVYVSVSILCLLDTRLLNVFHCQWDTTYITAHSCFVGVVAVGFCNVVSTFPLNSGLSLPLPRRSCPCPCSLCALHPTLLPPGRPVLSAPL